MVMKMIKCISGVTKDNINIGLKGELFKSENNSGKMRKWMRK